MTSTHSRYLTPEEQWQITCHEAGHAIVAVRHRILFDYVERGEGEHGLVKLTIDPLGPNNGLDESQLLQYQEFYAGGAAAERLLFNTDRDYALRVDKCCHNKLEQQMNRHRNLGFEGDIQSAVKLLDRCSIELVAKELDKRKQLTFEEVSVIIGCKPPWE